MTGRRDYAVLDLIIAGAVATTLTATFGLTLRSVASKQARMREIFPPKERPIRVRPVIDLQSPELLKYGGRAKAKLPKEWEVRSPEERAPPPDAKPDQREARVSTAAKDDPSAIPDASVLVSDAGDPDELLSDAGATGDGGVSEGPDGAGGGAPGGDPDGSPLGSDAGTSTDPLMKRAAREYRGRIYGFLYSGWSCPAGANGSCSGSAQISGLVVGSGSVSGCSDPTMQPAAAAHINSKIGQSIPPPPEKYPQLAPNHFVISYKCP